MRVEKQISKAAFPDFELFFDTQTWKKKPTVLKSVCSQHPLQLHAAAQAGTTMLLKNEYDKLSIKLIN